MASISCPHCRKASHYSGVTRGKRLNCPKCGSSFVIKSPTGNASAPTFPAANVSGGIPVAKQSVNASASSPIKVEYLVIGGGCALFGLILMALAAVVMVVLTQSTDSKSNRVAQTTPNAAENQNSGFSSDANSTDVPARQRNQRNDNPSDRSDSGFRQPNTTSPNTNRPRQSTQSKQSNSSKSKSSPRKVDFSKSKWSIDRALQQSVTPEFPELSPSYETISGVKIHFVDLAPANRALSNRAGTQMKMRIYVPANSSATNSCPLVLVAPAGTNLLHGNEVDQGDYHKETLPYAQAGMCVIQYSIDGKSSGTNDGLKMRATYLDFLSAGAGVVNARNAIDFALSKLPFIDKTRIYSAGHSSAGTLSLLASQFDNRIAAAIAYAPATDFDQRLGKLRSTRGINDLFPGFANYLDEAAPAKKIDRMHAPTFVFHARDDSNVPVETAESFCRNAVSKGKNVELSLTDRGEHYQSMIDAGIPRALKWLKDGDFHK